MLDLCRLIFGMVIDLLRSRVALEAEILVLRQQINVLRRTRPRRPPFISIDRLILRPTVPGLEDVPPQSCRQHRGDGSVRRTDDLISLAAKSLFEEFDPWAFVIDRRRRARHGKTHMPNG
jgi:hypothetical protein